MKRAYTYEELGKLKDRILSICEEVARLNPVAWQEAHNGNWDDESARFNDLCVQALRKEGIFAGRNGKRGGSQLSDDILAFGLVRGEGGALDLGGTFAEMAIIDYIANAGTSNASIGWLDVSAAAPGRFADPQGLSGVLPGDKPSVPVPPSTPQPPAPIPPPNYSAELTAIAQELVVMVSRLTALEKKVESTSKSNYELIANEVIANHLDDIKSRIDAVMGAVSAINGFKCKIPW